MLIDLDVAPPPVPVRSRRPPWRTIRVVVAAAVLLLLDGAAVAPRPVVFPQVAATGAESVVSSTLTPEALFTAREEDDGVTVVARPLVAGGPSWQAEARGVASDGVELSRSGSVLVVRDGDTLRVLDVATGQERWAVQQELTTVLGDHVLITGEEGGVRFADLETGRVRWRQQTSPAEAALDSSGRFLCLFDIDSTLQVRSVTDGRLLAQRTLVDLSETLGPTIVGDRVYLLGASTVIALRLDDLTTAWTGKPLVLTPTVVAACGDLICVRARSGVSGLDPATGALRWTGPGWVGWSSDSSSAGLAGGIAQRSDGSNAVLDPATGGVVRLLGRGRVAGDLMLRLDGDRTQVTDLRTGRLYGTLTEVAPYGCTAAGDFLACRKHGGITVWKIVRTGS
ncbi:PQQ-binding-like beta-propeller repeat protein [Actinoplanes sp. NPDC020271]|uniref:outer membrane protein assembly factor BamB family protein n=1 Tax=Actinoplanes sp. NPDC020271 TaxID=3363896 RepID=UPI0037B59320